MKAIPICLSILGFLISFSSLPVLSSPILTKTEAKIYLQSLPPKEKAEIPIQIRQPVSLRVDECGNGKISTSIKADLIEVEGKIVQVTKLPITDKSTCGKSSQLRTDKKQQTYILSGLPAKKSLTAQLIVSQKKKVSANKCGFASLELKQKMVGYAEKNVDTIYSVNGKTLSSIPNGEEPVCRGKKSSGSKQPY
jgi:hypothetical protein